MTGRAPRRTAHRRGLAAERLCVLRLRCAGWRVLARRFASPVGEIDIVAARRRTLVFIEVKYRQGAADALAAVTPAQRVRIERAAAMFLSRYPKWRKLMIRFDVMIATPGRWPRHLPDAWRPRGALGRGGGQGAL